MRYFIDTNIFLFFIAEPNELDSSVTALFEDYENSFIISSESIREIAMLIKGGRLNNKIWRTYADVRNAIDKHGIEVRYVAEAHLKTLYNLHPHHSDPADLMIISQAITEGIPLISSDAKFPLYTKQGLRFIHNRR